MYTVWGRRSDLSMNIGHLWRRVWKGQSRATEGQYGWRYKWSPEDISAKSKLYWDTNWRELLRITCLPNAFFMEVWKDERMHPHFWYTHTSFCCCCHCEDFLHSDLKCWVYESVLSGCITVWGLYFLYGKNNHCKGYFVTLIVCH